MSDVLNISSLSVGNEIDSEPFLVDGANTRKVRNGSIVTNLNLRNSTGQIPAVIWDNPQPLNDGVIVKASGNVGSFNGSLQVTVWAITPVLPEQATELIEHLLPPRHISEDDIRASFSSVLSGIKDEDLKLLVSYIIDVYSDRFWKTPAGKRLHHAWIGGLAEHSVAVASIVKQMAPAYPGVNPDIAIAGALLHDIGKVKELAFTGGFQYTDVGKLLSHTFIGADIVSALSQTRPYRIDEQSLVHIILSHHREPEFGALVKPATLEAEIVALADLMDSSMVGLSEFIRADVNPGEWTAYNARLGRSMRKPLLASGKGNGADVAVEGDEEILF